jgi:hypothetical protein
MKLRRCLQFFLTTAPELLLLIGWGWSFSSGYYHWFPISFVFFLSSIAIYIRLFCLGKGLKRKSLLVLRASLALPLYLELPMLVLNRQLHDLGRLTHARGAFSHEILSGLQRYIQEEGSLEKANYGTNHEEITTRYASKRLISHYGKANINVEHGLEYDFVGLNLYWGGDIFGRHGVLLFANGAGDHSNHISQTDLRYTIIAPGIYAWHD